MVLHVHRAARTDLLADGLAEVLRERPSDPFQPELVVVPARGVERWLTQRLSHRLGVSDRSGDGLCAGVEFLRPTSLVALLTGTERTDPWHPDRLVWSVLGVIDAGIDEEWCRPLATHLGHFFDGVEAELRRSRRYSVARRLAGHFASYAAQRPALLVQWSAGNNGDGAGGALPADLAWQPELWRRVAERVGGPTPDVRHEQTLARLRAGAVAPGVPQRLSMFGHTRLALTEVELLDALAVHRDVHVWLPEPSSALTVKLAGFVADGPVRRDRDDSVRAVSHPLLASLGRDTRELTRALARTTHTPHAHPSGEATPNTLLGWLQADLAADQVPGPDVTASRVLAPGDRSVQVHACHGPARQVEVLREVLVGLLQDQPDLQPRDIVVMCPDIEVYAPLIQAAFGLGAEAGLPAVGTHPAHQLRVRLADRDLAVTNPLLGVARQLIAVASGRATASEVLDLISTAPVRRRFGFSDNDLDTITSWVQESGVRWGLDAQHRARFGLAHLEQNTWLRGLDRVLLGVALAEEADRRLGSTLPLDSVPSGQIELAGSLAELLSRIHRAVDALLSSGPATEWMSALREGVSSITAVPLRDAWMSAQFERELAHLAHDGSGADGVSVRLADVRTLLEDVLRGRPTRSNFRTGSLTVCTMTPMRSVPHKVVCLLGLDDGSFPRVTTLDGDDALARAPMTGERDLRSEDRQLLLDAIMAAGQTLVLTYSGASEHTGQTRPPAVPVGEILEALARTTASDVSGVHLHHPLQPFNDRNFTITGPDSLGTSRPFSFDPTSAAGAQARRDQHPRPPLVTAPLFAPEPDLTLADLKGFLRNPAKTFLKACEIAVPWDEDPIRDAIPITLDGLESWAIGDRFLQALVTGADESELVRSERLRGLLPPGDLGDRALADVLDKAHRIASASAPDRVGVSAEIAVSLGLPGGSLTGSVSGCHGQSVVHSAYSSMGAKVIAPLWVDVLALAAQTDAPATGMAYARFGKSVRKATIGPVNPDDARAFLEDLAASCREGMRTPVPLPLATGFAWAREGNPREARFQADKSWRTSPSSPFPGEDQDSAFVRLYGSRASLQTLIGAGLPQWAHRIWSPATPLLKGRV